MNGKTRKWDSENLMQLSERLGDLLRKKQWRLITAESCTGGGIAQAVTAVAGSSEWYEGGFITYSNTMKSRQLSVPSSLFLTHGAVSEPVVKAMAEGAVTASGAEVAIAVSGIAGPEGAVVDKPLGTVWLAWWLPVARVYTQHFCFGGNREQVRAQSVYMALQGLYSLCRDGKLCFNDN